MAKSQKLTDKEGKLLLKLAHDSISSAFAGKKLDIDEKIQKKFSEARGVFVTITIKDELRGCIGFVEPIEPLWKAVVDAARHAAFSDPRFPALTASEFASKSTALEVSVLTQPKLIKVSEPKDYLKKIRVGKHGLIAQMGGFSGLLLPQVFTDWKADALRALEMTCQKAGLDVDAWQSKSCKVYSFEAQVFS
jgi:hypothetical protein